MTDLALVENGLTICDRQGNSLVFERWDDGSISSWTADKDGTERFARGLSTDDRLRIIAFLSRGLS